MTLWHSVAQNLLTDLLHTLSTTSLNLQLSHGDDISPAQCPESDRFLGSLCMCRVDRNATCVDTLHGSSRKL